MPEPIYTDFKPKWMNEDPDMPDMPPVGSSPDAESML